MSAESLAALARTCDDLLIVELIPALRAQIARLHEKGISRALMTKLLKQLGGTRFVVLACQALWDRLEAERLRGK